MTRQDQQVAVGAHLADAVYQAPETTVETMLERLDLADGDEATFLVFGGEVGQNTNPDGQITMDYSCYYPFFQEVANHGTIGNYNFPSNGTGVRTSTGAAITADAVNVWINE